MSSMSYEHAFDNPKKSRKLMTHHFHPKVYQKLIIFLILCSLWIGPKQVRVWKRPKTCLSKFDIKFLVFVYFWPCVISRIVTLNSACWGILHNRYRLPLDFFPILPVLATFWIAKSLIFFDFPTPIFFWAVPVELMFTNIATDYWAKTAICPYCGIVWVLFCNIWRFSMKICTTSRNLGWKPWKFQQNGRCLGSRLRNKC